MSDETRERFCFSSIANGNPNAKKADVEEYPWVIDHVGLLFNKPLGSAGVPFV